VALNFIADKGIMRCLILFLQVELRHLMNKSSILRMPYVDMLNKKTTSSCGNFSLILALLFTISCATKKETVPSSSSKVHTVFKSRYAQRSYLRAYDIALKGLWGVPYDEKDIKTIYGNAHVIISGPANAKPLVLLHGMNASSTMWYPNIKDFSKTYRVYCIDFILEPGKSLSHGQIESTEDIVKWYDEVFDQLKINNFSIVGASRGGWLALHLKFHAKHHITKLALLSPAQTFSWIKPKRQVLANIFFTMYPRRPHLRKVMKTLTFNVDQISQLYYNQYFIAVAKTKTKTKANKSLLSMKPFSEDELKSLKIPVLVLIGEHDIINGKDGLQKAKDFIPNVQAEVVEETSHFLSFDRPEVIDKKVLDFLENEK